MKTYSLDLRERVLDAVDGGMPRKEVVRIFKVSLPTIKRFIKLREETGSVAPKPRPGMSPRIGPDQHAALWAQLIAHDDSTLAKHCELWEEEQGVKVSVSTMSRAIRQLGWTYKKGRWMPRAGREDPSYLERAG